MGYRIWLIANDEWRYWRRSHLAMSVLIIALVLAIASVVVTFSTVSLAAHQRAHLQSQAEQKFVEQPDRHPHRMVHYGHYLFRTPPPLGRLDPGVDAYTGTAIFLEGHRQNGATFSGQQHSGGLTWLSALSPAFVMQILTPLLLIVMGFGVMTREREAGTFDFLKIQGVSPLTLTIGKSAALSGVGFAVLVPVAAGALITLFYGASILSVAAFIFSYAIYIGIWCALILLVSTLSRSHVGSFSALIILWVVLCLLLPRIATNTAVVAVHSPSKLETDFAILQKLREMGDGHNANDPAFKALKDNLLAKYNVESVEALPVNFKGIVAQKSEADLTEVLNDFAEQKMDEGLAQAKVARQFGWLSPVIAIQTASMKLAGTDLENYQRFLREAESVRFSFVQSLNKLHAEGLSYAADANKYQSHETLEKAKVSASNWRILNDFTFSPLSAVERFKSSMQALMQLFVLWLVVSIGVFWAGKKQ